MSSSRRSHRIFEKTTTEEDESGRRRSSRLSVKPLSVETKMKSQPKSSSRVHVPQKTIRESSENSFPEEKNNSRKRSIKSTKKTNILMSPNTELAAQVGTLEISSNKSRKGTASSAVNVKKKLLQEQHMSNETQSISRSISEETPEKKLRNGCSSVSETEPSQTPPTGALRGRIEEFEYLKLCIMESKENNESLSIYVSGQPGTGKTATTMRVLQALHSSVRSCIINCASTNTMPALFKAIFESLNLSGKPNVENFEKHIKQFRTSLVLVLDEIDHLANRKNSALYSAFQWPETLSNKVVILGIANSIDLTERLLPKLMLAKPPKRLVFHPYSKDVIADILNDKMKSGEEFPDSKSIELTARKVAAMSGDLRTALHIFKQQKSLLNSAHSKDVASGTPANGCREVLGIINSVYSSPLARARLPLQPRILLAVSLTLSSSKKNKFDRCSLLQAYYEACKALRMPALDDDDLHSAFQTLESQSFIRELNGGKLVLQVDAPTAKLAISDNAMLDQIGLLHL